MKRIHLLNVLNVVEEGGVGEDIAVLVDPVDRELEGQLQLTVLFFVGEQGSCGTNAREKINNLVS